MDKTLENLQEVSVSEGIYWIVNDPSRHLHPGANKIVLGGPEGSVFFTLNIKKNGPRGFQAEVTQLCPGTPVTVRTQTGITRLNDHTPVSILSDRPTFLYIPLEVSDGRLVFGCLELKIEKEQVKLYWAYAQED